jgi:hydrogenase nickel incorporation protein HypA/HybF
MHEFSLAKEIESIVALTLAEKPARLIQVNLVVGGLSGVLPEALLSALELISAEGPLKGAKFSIREDKATFKCKSCGALTTTQPPFFCCEQCGSWDGELGGGSELNIESLEVEQ